MHVQVEDTSPWYKQFWPWALMVMPATAVVAGLYTYSLAASGSSGLVVDDYYNAGKAINRSLAKGQKAAAMGLQGKLTLDGQSVQLALDNADIQAQQQLVLKLYHATFPGRDQSVLLSKAGSGQWSGRIHDLSAGKWYIHLMPMDESWRLQGTLPKVESATLDLQPDL
ncbi:FixH family protein [Thiothrix nivea]|uniref:FixH family protein n=1 Tax=Thiothrix nivea (strain ATCC 35100 / DSM 5205 / JP2) TaxID=870187 RepID=A0A656HMS0_THINJ|nr:FixH family protein [Thiothrix nivea]EIJ36619.1 FixH family protein [Thiothrix nivea DSM 5205]